MRGKRVVLCMILLVLLNAALHTYLAIAGHVHPLTLTFDYTYTAHVIINGLFTAVLLLCLFLVYRGSPSVRHLFGGCAAIATLSILVTIAIEVMGEMASLPWVVLDLAAVFIAAFATWTCFFSISASRFFSHQKNRY